MNQRIIAGKRYGSREASSLISRATRGVRKRGNAYKIAINADKYPLIHVERN